MAYVDSAAFFTQRVKVLGLSSFQEIEREASARLADTPFWLQV